MALSAFDEFIPHPECKLVPVKFDVGLWVAEQLLLPNFSIGGIFPSFSVIFTTAHKLLYQYLRETVRAVSIAVPK